jgi:hypothetical protein
LNAKHDWPALEREYVTGEMSMRELATAHGIKNHSVVTGQAKSREWSRKRTEYRAGVETKAMVYMADQEGARIAQEARVRDNAIEGIDDAITKMRADMKRTEKKFVNGEWVDEPLYTLRPHDIVELIDRLQVLFNRPSTITEERSLGINVTAGGVPHDLLRGIVEATRGLTDTGAAAQSPFPRIDRAREN